MKTVNIELNINELAALINLVLEDVVCNTQEPQLIEKLMKARVKYREQIISKEGESEC